jgi:L-alanine-DL-glutamate epimerase-like enolase superfamily enzyme
MIEKRLTIKQVEVYKAPVRLTEPFVTSLGALDWAPNVVIVIRTDKGISGFGECSPYMAINGESIDTCYVVAEYLAGALIGQDPLKPGKCLALMDGIIYGNSSIKSAFDIALHDIAAQNEDLPLYAFLGGKNGKILTTDYTVSIGEAGKMATDAVRTKERGFRVIKVKLGESKEKDVERIRRIREAVGNDIPLRIDANQGWDPGRAADILTALSVFNIQFCEEPIARHNFMDLPQLKSRSPIPIMADESCCDHHDARRLIRLDACDMFNVKLGKSSGIQNAVRIIRLAEDAGMKLQVGGFLESRLGFTAAAHLALTSDNIIYCDFDTPLMFVDDPVAGGISYEEGGKIGVPDTPGLGATIDHAWLKTLKKKVIS